jgi:hypothetical protein
MGNFDDAINDYTLALERDQVRAESMYTYTHTWVHYHPLMLGSIDGWAHFFSTLRGTLSSIHSRMHALFFIFG